MYNRIYAMVRTQADEITTQYNPEIGLNRWECFAFDEIKRKFERNESERQAREVIAMIKAMTN